MKKIKNLFLLTMLFALCSCGNSIDSDPAEYSQQVVTNGTLYTLMVADFYECMNS